VTNYFFFFFFLLIACNATDLFNDNGRQTDRHFYLTSEKIRCRGEENDRKVFESSSPAKYKSNCTEDDQKSTKFI